jgi:hypothetical protein
MEAQQESPQFQVLSKDDYLAWVDHPITQLFLLGVEYEVLNAADQIRGHTVDEYAVLGARYDGVRLMAEHIMHWSPDFGEDDEA